MEKKLDTIITKLESIEKRLDVIETNCNSMHKHITFIDSVYTTAKMPLDLLFKSINLISGKKEYLCLPEKT
tara:strand:- start:310 stop:522 length:213 start_codon:yes stop_codon:yes gene_type:complete